MKRMSGVLSLIGVIVVLLFSFNVYAKDTGALANNYTGKTEDEAIWNKRDNSSFITSKNAKWTDSKKYLAELELSINGTQKTDGIDIVIALDRSGSMDMSYLGNRDSHTFSPTYGYPLYSGPCLDADHFYLAPVARKISGLDPTKEYQFWRNFSSGGSRDITIKYYNSIAKSAGGTYTGWAANNIPTSYISSGILTGDLLDLDAMMEAPYNNKIFKESSSGSTVYYDSAQNQWYEYNYSIPEPTANADITKGYDIGNGKLAVYKGDYNTWVEVDSTNQVHVYDQFSPDNAKYIPYHFKMVNGEYKLISHWDNNLLGGTFITADKNEGCYDRWSEAKDAISIITKKVLAQGSNNRVALVPFSVRDSTMVGFLNGATDSATLNQSFRNSIIEKNPLAFDPATTGVSVGQGNKLTGNYKSWVDFTSDSSKITDMLPRLFTTGQTDYVYGLSMAYNLLHESYPKVNKQSTVLFISDGEPYSMDSTGYIPGSGNIISSFLNSDVNISGLTKAIKSGDAFVSDGNFFKDSAGIYQRHDINPSYLITDPNNVIGVKGLSTNLLTVGYMINGEIPTAKTRLKNMASSQDNFYDIPATSKGAAEGYLAEQLSKSSIFPGGREAVLYDNVSKYYYVPDNWVNPYANVVIEGSQNESQRIVWKINDIYKYLAKDEPSIKIPLVLREEYRNVDKTKYYPTNNDPNPNLDNAAREADGPNTGAKLYYKDFNDTWRYDTIGTPKLPVNPLNSGKVEILKVNQDSDKLKGAIFDIKNADGKIIETITTDANGIGRSNIALAPGSYKLVEKKAPSGYVLDTTPHLFKITEGATKAVHIDVVNKKAIKDNTLPLTGKNDIVMFNILLLGVGIVLISMRKNKGI